LVKKQCLYSKYYPEFSEFKLAISNFIDPAHQTHKKELNSLLSLKFQTFSKAHFMTVKSIVVGISIKNSVPYPGLEEHLILP